MRRVSKIQSHYIDKLTDSGMDKSVNAIQKCHRLCKPEMSPKGLTVAQPDRVETSDIGALAGCAGGFLGAFASVVPVQF